MARYIDKEKLLNRMKQDPLFPLVERYGVSGVIEAEPTADVVEVVRCKDCKWMDVFCCCTKFNVVIATRSTFFCALGERRDDEQEERVHH